MNCCSTCNQEDHKERRAGGKSSPPSSLRTSLSLMNAVMEERQGSMLSCHGSSSSSKLSKNLLRILWRQEATQENISTVMSLLPSSTS